MTITQTIDVPADRRVTLPKEVPTGRVVLAFTPVALADEATEAAPTHPCPICAKNLDENGDYRFGPKTAVGLAASLEESRAMKRGEIPAKWFNSLDDMIADLESDDEDDE